MSFVATSSEHTVPIALIRSALGDSDPHHGRVVYLNSSSDDEIVKQELAKQRAAEDKKQANKEAKTPFASGVGDEDTEDEDVDEDSALERVPAFRSTTQKRARDEATQPSMDNFVRAKQQRISQTAAKFVGGADSKGKSTRGVSASDKKAVAVEQRDKAEQKRLMLIRKLSAACDRAKQTDIQLDRFSVFDPLVDPKTRGVWMIVGQSGSGKSTFASQLAQSYHREFPDNPIFVFSRVDTDPAFEGVEALKGAINRVQWTDEMEPVDISELKNSLCIFDDIDHFPESMLDKIYKLRDTCLEIGRHARIHMIVTSHLFMGGTKKISTMKRECNRVVVFPNAGAAGTIATYLRQDHGMSTGKIKDLLNTKSRWIAFCITCKNLAIVSAALSAFLQIQNWCSRSADVTFSDSYERLYRVFRKCTRFNAQGFGKGPRH